MYHAAREAPQGVERRIHGGESRVISTSRGRDDDAAAVGLVVGVGPHPVARARAQVGGVRAVGGEDDRAPAAEGPSSNAAALGAGVLRVDRLDRPPGRGDAELDELPVALVAPGADDPAVLVLVGVVEPVLDPGAAVAAGRRLRP